MNLIIINTYICAKFFYRMKKQIFDALKTKYAQLGLSDRALDGVASLLEKTITDANGIDAAISEASVAGLLKGYQSELDALRTGEAAAKRDLEEYKKAHPAGDPNHQDPPKDANAEVLRMLQELKASNESLKNRLDESESKARRADLLAQVRATLKQGGRGIDPLLDVVLFSPQIADTDTAETLVERYTKDYDDKYALFYGNGAVPPAGTPTPSQQGYKKGMFAGAIRELENRGLLEKDK